MSITLTDVARSAKVSVSTACRALNQHAAISPQTVNRVCRVAKELGYLRRRAHRRVGAAEFLSGTRIGLVSLGMDETLLTLPTVATTLVSVQNELAQAAARVEVVHLPDPSRMPKDFDVQQWDGLILVGAMQGDMYRRGRRFFELAAGLPMIWGIGRPGGCPGDAVVSNDFETGQAAALYLVERGHHHIAIINPKPDHLLFCRREDGFVAAAQRLGVRAECYRRAPEGGWPWPLKPPQDVDTVQALVDEVLEMDPRPTAIMAVADSVATLVYRALFVRGLKVGKGMAVISANHDDALIEGLHPTLTTFDIHQDRIGRLAVHHLAVRLAGSELEGQTEWMVRADLVEGESVPKKQTKK